MATLSLDELLPEVLVYVPNAPDPLVFRFLREAARTLCTSAKVLRYTTPPIILRTASPHALPTLVDMEFVEIESAWVNEPGGGRNMLVPVTVGWLDANQPGWDAVPPVPPSSTARYVTQLNPDTVQLVPAEYLPVNIRTSPPTLQLRCVMQPSRNCITIDGELVYLFGTLIGRGAAALLLMMPGADFANPNLGAAMWSAFTAKIASLKTEHTKGQQGARLRTTGVWF